MKFKYPYCKIRKDLLEKEERIPIWNNQITTYIWGKQRAWRYRWSDAGIFQIKYANLWWNGYSIDFDFFNPKRINYYKGV